jgi:hypothetical protein
VELDGGIQHQLHYRLCPPRKKFTRKITTESFPHGWSKPNADDWQFNLEATDNQLLESLKGSVNEIVMFAKLTGPQRLENVTISLTDPFTPPTKLCGLPEGGLLEELAFHVGVATHFRSAK